MMGAYSHVKFETGEHIARITLNTPEKGNMINGDVARELETICESIRLDKDIYVIIITAAGNRYFCTGCEDPREKWPVAGLLASLEQPVIAALNGDAIGQGLELALSCDIRIAVDTARFGMNQVESGYLPFDGGTQRLPRIVGRTRALEMILTSKIIDAVEALNTGLVHRVVPGNMLAAEVDNMARTMVTRAPLAVRYAKEAVLKGLDLTVEQGLRLEADLYYLLHTTGDRTEGITAFRQKRKPDFKGS